MTEVTKVSTICVVGILRVKIPGLIHRSQNFHGFLIMTDRFLFSFSWISWGTIYATFLRKHLVCLERIIVLDLYWESKIWLWRPSVTSLPLQNSWTHTCESLDPWERQRNIIFLCKINKFKKVNWQELIRRYLNREITLTSLYIYIWHSYYTYFLIYTTRSS